MAREIMASAMRDVYNIIRRRREKLGTRQGEEEIKIRARKTACRKTQRK